MRKDIKYLKYHLADIKFFMKRDDASGVQVVIEIINRKQLAEVSGIEYRRLCRLLRKEVMMTKEEVAILARVIKVRHCLIQLYVARRVN